ncbi:hypothetical protein ISF6_3790 [Piscinibacter sakaiensis]|uniref:Uncharacterized protein n=1 Tax=Piscinibacter sakaiensis TaxID=1547922 RepID=A0A0K8P6K5_PISS1|nr:hypothetical protein ISF6_3790 [Piscinibacter sakaiensis]
MTWARSAAGLPRPQRSWAEALRAVDTRALRSSSSTASMLLRSRCWSWSPS